MSDGRSSNLKERGLLSRRFFAFALLFGIGLGVRVALVPYLGTKDMETYAQWGRHTNNAGLTSAYIGIYFPFAYQFFAREVTLASWLGVSTFSVMKAVNLGFDLGTFATLLWFLREHRRLTLDAELIEKVSQVVMKLTPVLRPGRDLMK